MIQDTPFLETDHERAMLPAAAYAAILSGSQAVMRGHLSFASFCDRVAEQARGLMDADGAAVLAVEATLEQLVPRAAAGDLAILMDPVPAGSRGASPGPPPCPAGPRPLPLSHSALIRAVQEDRLVLLRSGAGSTVAVETESGPIDLEPTAADRAFFAPGRRDSPGTLAAMPLWCHDRVGGILVVHRRGEVGEGASAGFDADHRSRLTALADLAAVTLSNSHLRERVEEDQRRQDIVAEHSSDMISVHDPQGHYLYASPAARCFLHIEPEGVVGRSAYDFIHPADLSAVRAAHEQVLTGDAPNLVAFRLCPVDGDAPRWVETSVRLVRDPATDDLCRLVCITRDVTEQVEAREQLRASRRELENIINDQVEMIVRTDPSGLITFCNTAFSSLVGRSPESLVGEDIYQFVPPERRETVRRHFAARTPEDPVWRHEHSMTRADGQRVWHRWTNRALFDERGRLIGKQGVGIDITDRREAEQAIRDSEQRQRAIADRLQILLHELDHRVKNNLAELHSLVALYADSKSTVEGFAEAIGGKLQAMKTVHELIAAGGWRPLDLLTIVTALRDDFRCARGPMNLTITGGSVIIPARQASALAMILHELLTNSQKHGALCRPGAAVTVDWREHAPEGAAGIRRVDLAWREHGMDAPAVERQGGQGLALIRGLAAFNLGGEATFHFAERHFSADLRFMLPRQGDPEVRPEEPDDHD